MALRRRVFLVLASAVTVLAVYVAVQFRADMRAARAAVASYDTIAVATSFGSIELVDLGSGFPVLSIHGTGGGFDQGLALAGGLRDRAYRVIAPSRFGYLGAPIPERTDAIVQADAFDEQLRRSAFHKLDVYAGHSSFERIGDRGELGADIGQRRVAIGHREIGEVDVDRKSRHVPQEQVDGSAALEREVGRAGDRRQTADQKFDLASITIALRHCWP